MKQYFKKLVFSLSLLTSIFISYAYALEQNGKLWLAINSLQTLSEDKKWLMSIYAQLRFINKSHPLQRVLFENGYGYQLVPDKSIWLGFVIIAQNPYNGFYREGRLYQQLIWKLKQDDIMRLTARTRLEEAKRSNKNQIGIRLRQRLAMESRCIHYKKFYPFMYEEAFLQLNKTDFTSHRLMSENRVFIGFNLYLSDKAWWEIGYMNQYILSTPQSEQNEMDHVLSFTYNFT